MTQIITIDGVEYNLENPSDGTEAQIKNLKFVNERLLQKNNEMQVLDTARLVYIKGLKQEIELKG